MKVILGTGDLMTLRNVARASLVAMMAGADFIKTSTGKETMNATLPVGFVMVRAIREYAQRDRNGSRFQARGRDTHCEAIHRMVGDDEGRAWATLDAPSLFRFGASSLLNDIERQLEHFATGRYSADYHHPIA